MDEQIALDRKAQAAEDLLGVVRAAIVSEYSSLSDKEIDDLLPDDIEACLGDIIDKHYETERSGYEY